MNETTDRIDEMVDKAKEIAEKASKIVTGAVIVHDLTAYVGSFVVVNGTLKKLCPYKGILPAFGRFAISLTVANKVVDTVGLTGQIKEMNNGGDTDAGEGEIIRGEFSNTETEDDFLD